MLGVVGELRKIAEDRVDNVENVEKRGDSRGKFFASVRSDFFCQVPIDNSISRP